LTRSLDRIVKAGPTEHEVTRFLDVAKLLGADPMKAEHFASIASKRETTALLVAPESDYFSNYEWPAERWVDLITQLKNAGRELIIGHLRKGGLAQKIADQTECETLTIDLTSPASFTSHSDLLAADGSLPHLAAAFGATCAVLFGPADPELTRPLGKQHLIIRKKVECSPCFLSKCPIDLRCQNDLDVERVIGRLKSLNPA
jgi:ADP-heptose:LPS heptosyltransferase